MKQRLPEYVINCFLSAGYDELNVQCNLDISENSNNGIAKVEQFINRKFSNKADYDPTLSTPSKFPRDHGERIFKSRNIYKKVLIRREAVYALNAPQVRDQMLMIVLMRVLVEVLMLSQNLL